MVALLQVEGLVMLRWLSILSATLDAAQRIRAWRPPFNLGLVRML